MREPDAAVAIVHAHGAADSVLLMRRAEREADSWSGHWSFPGGRREPEDADSLDTALRELEEECGIRLERERLERTLPVATARRRVGRFLKVAPFVLSVEAEYAVSLDEREAVEAVWAPLRVLRDPARHRLQAVAGHAPAFLFPAIDLNGVPLWGFTYRLLMEWLGLVPPGPEAARAGFQAAQELLAVLADWGCATRDGWHNRGEVRVASVQGSIPAEPMIALLGAPGSKIPRVSLVEVTPDYVRLIGLGFEEYRIERAG